MKYLLQFSIIGLITFVAELLSYFIPIPVPAGIYGLIILFILLTLKVIKLEWVEDAANFLLSVMSIMFVPAIVSLITKWDAIKNDVVGIVVTAFVSTIVTIIVSGVVTNILIKRRNKKQMKAEENV